MERELDKDYSALGKEKKKAVRIADKETKKVVPSPEESPQLSREKSLTGIYKGLLTLLGRKKLSPRLILGENEAMEVYTVRFSLDGRLLAAGCGDGTIKVYSSNTGKHVYSLGAPNSHEHPLPSTCVRWRPTSPSHKTKNILIAANSDGTVRHWHVTSGKCVHRLAEEGNQIFAVDYKPDAEQFATAGKDYAVRVYDERTKVCLATLRGGHGEVTAGHANRVFSLKFHPVEASLIISGGWDNTIQVWDTRVKHAVRSIFGPHICGDAVDIFESTLLSGSWRPEEALQLWDFGSGRLIETVPWGTISGEAQEPCLLYAAQFSKDPSAQFIAAGGTGSNETKIFHRTSKQIAGEIYGLKRGIYTMDFSFDSKMLALGGADSLMIFEPYRELAAKK